jgi:hypothetical protein
MSYGIFRESADNQSYKIPCQSLQGTLTYKGSKSCCSCLPDIPSIFSFYSVSPSGSGAAMLFEQSPYKESSYKIKPAKYEARCVRDDSKCLLPARSSETRL